LIVNNVYESSIDLSKVIGELNESINEISNILTVINDIADKTNLLSLNAAIEAARAGEQGRGFAVVADEVGKLAVQTKTATTEISKKISAVLEKSGQTTISMNEASSDATKATKFMQDVGESLNSIVNIVQDVQNQIVQIAISVEEQSRSVEEIFTNVEKTSQISKNVGKESSEVILEVNKMITTAEDLRKSITGFKTKGGELLIFDLAKTDHRLWVNKVSSCLRGGERLDPSTLTDHTLCRLGKWYYTDGRQFCGNLSSFKAIEAPHKKLHALGKDIVSIYNNGDKERAKKLLEELEILSGQIINLLEEAKKGATEIARAIPGKPE
ncbi:MAG: CZB domain-containing protein, partial [Nitrospirae bacterium]|nr:CZB domain-containing protein [Nitrospirota bacterium]